MSVGKRVLKNLSMVVSSNVIILILGVIISFILPIFLTVENYGYWQLYNYYLGFVGLFMFGFSDGMNLRYAGRSISKLNITLFQKFLKYTSLHSLMISIIGILFLVCIPSGHYRMIYLSIVINIFLFNVNGFFIHLHQMTLRFKEYSIANAMERVLFVLFILPMFYFKTEDITYYISINIICRMCAIIYNVFSLRQLFFTKKTRVFSLKYEILENFKSGFPLTLASICSMLMTTMARFIVGQLMSIKMYGIFSFGSATINLVIQVILAMSSVFYPTLKTMNFEKNKKVYPILHDALIVFCGLSLLTYYGIYFIIVAFFNKYISVLDYLYLLFPTILFQSINSLIISNFSRILRLERTYFFSNFIFLIINFILTYTAGIITHSTEFILLVSLIGMQLWVLYGEIYLSYYFGDEANKSLCFVIVIVFILLNLALPIKLSCIFYLLFIIFITFIYVKKHKIAFQQLVLGDM